MGKTQTQYSFSLIHGVSLTTQPDAQALQKRKLFFMRISIVPVELRLASHHRFMAQGSDGCRAATSPYVAQRGMLIRFAYNKVLRRTA